MAERQFWPLNRLIGLLKKRPSPRNIRVAKYDPKRVVTEKPFRSLQEPPPRKSEKEPLIVEGSATQGTAEPSTMSGPHTSAPALKQRVPEGLRPDLPADIIKLAAQNAAFLQGLLALQRMNLDEDLFQDSVEDLRQKYYRERNKILQPPDSQA